MDPAAATFTTLPTSLKGKCRGTSTCVLSPATTDNWSYSELPQPNTSPFSETKTGWGLLNQFPQYCYSGCCQQMETFSALLAICAGNSPVTGEFPAKGQWRGALMFFYLHLYQRLSKQSWGWWFEMPSCSLWRQCNVYLFQYYENNSCLLTHWGLVMHICISKI